VCEKYDAALNRKKPDVAVMAEASTPVLGPCNSRPSAHTTMSDAVPSNGFNSHIGTCRTRAPANTSGHPGGKVPNTRP
jgi:hypothetical protein